MEAIIWYILGYGAMPVIFIGGFAVTAIFACFILNALGMGVAE